MQAVTQDNMLLTVGEVANRLRVDQTTVRRWIKQGLVDAVTLPHKGKRQIYRVESRTLDSLLTGDETTLDSDYSPRSE